MSELTRIAFLFPGQGTQHIGMGSSFFQNFTCAKETLEEACDILREDLSSIINTGPEKVLTETKNSQVAIYVVSIAILRVIKELFPHIKPYVTGGLSLGEYTAATAADYFSFRDCLPLVRRRGELMNIACEETAGTMAIVLGMTSEEVETMVKNLNLPQDLWVANYNCPGQVVISGTRKGIDAGIEAARKHGAKKVLPLQVHGAFHSGLMQHAEEGLKEHVLNAPLKYNGNYFIMNVTGNLVKSESELRENLIRQVTGSVRWEQGIREMAGMGVELYLEMGPGKTLSGFNKRINVPAPTVSIETVDDIKNLEMQLSRL